MLLVSQQGGDIEGVDSNIGLGFHGLDSLDLLTTTIAIVTKDSSSEMRLLNTTTYLLHENDELPGRGNPLPPYAVLSHTWIPTNDDGVQEVTYQDMKTDFRRLRLGRLKSTGWLKLVRYCDFAASQGFEWAWMDTCCIDKTSPGDTQEAINAMFRWYRDAVVCYAYLVDVVATAQNETTSQVSDLMRQSNWFRRGWTLQELLAPPTVVFLNSNWEFLGTREFLAQDISSITKIDVENLVAFVPQNLLRASIASKLSWASERETTVEEDETYSLLGIFDLALPLIYGEGREQAFYRFQRELANRYDDDSLFAWHNKDAIVSRDLRRDREQTYFSGVLAPSIRCFRQSTDIRYRRTPGPFSLTNQGIMITRALHRMEGSFQNHAILEMNCYQQSSTSSPKSIGIVVGTNQPCQRLNRVPMVVRSSSNRTRSPTWTSITIDGEDYPIDATRSQSTVVISPCDVASQSLILSCEREAHAPASVKPIQLLLEGSPHIVVSEKIVNFQTEGPEMRERPLSELLNGPPSPIERNVFQVSPCSMLVLGVKTALDRRNPSGAHLIISVHVQEHYPTGPSNTPKPLLRVWRCASRQPGWRGSSESTSGAVDLAFPLAVGTETADSYGEDNYQIFVRPIAPASFPGFSVDGLAPTYVLEIIRKPHKTWDY